MKLKLELTCNNDAFQADPHAEIARILSIVAQEIGQDKHVSGLLYDANGNDVGNFRLLG